jgi:acyl-CoA reductase-like NAD-dependent aldehyde dehydrogenase
LRICKIRAPFVAERGKSWKSQKRKKLQKKRWEFLPLITLPELVRLCAQAKEASRVLANTPLEQRNRALLFMAEALEKNKVDILFRNEIDVEAGRRAGLNPALLDRLSLTARRVMDMAQGASRRGRSYQTRWRRGLTDGTAPTGSKFRKSAFPWA